MSPTQWYVQRGPSDVMGPVDDELLVQGLRLGTVPFTARIRQDGTESWVPLVTHPSCAQVIRQLSPPPAATSGAPPARAADPRVIRVAIIAGSLVGVGLLFTAGVAFGMKLAEPSPEKACAHAREIVKSLDVDHCAANIKVGLQLSPHAFADVPRCIVAARSAIDLAACDPKSDQFEACASLEQQKDVLAIEACQHAGEQCEAWGCREAVAAEMQKLASNGVLDAWKQQQAAKAKADAEAQAARAKADAQAAKDRASGCKEDCQNKWINCEAVAFASGDDPEPCLGALDRCNFGCVAKYGEP